MVQVTEIRAGLIGQYEGYNQGLVMLHVGEVHRLNDVHVARVHQKVKVLRSFFPEF